MNLTLKENPEGYELMLDNQKLRYVEGYRIVKSSNQSGTAELTLKILVKFTQMMIQRKTFKGLLTISSKWIQKRLESYWVKEMRKN